MLHQIPGQTKFDVNVVLCDQLIHEMIISGKNSQNICDILMLYKAPKKYPLNISKPLTGTTF